MTLDPHKSDHLALANLLAQFLDGYTVVDVGAHGTGEADVYMPALATDSALVVGFEPNATECARLNAQAGGRRQYYPYAIGDGMPGTFHLCRAPLTSSLLRPNQPLLIRYENLAELCEVIEEIPIETVRLDDINGIGSVDFLKLDIQGATLLALQSAQRILERTLVVHAETEFVPVYHNEALFSECELFLRCKGFMFHHFHHIEGRRMTFGNRVVGQEPSQALWADAVFVPSFERLDTLSASELVRLAWTMHTVYGACDMAMACLARCCDEDNEALASSYQALLAAHGMLA